MQRPWSSSNGETEHDHEVDPLRVITAQLLLATAAGSAFGQENGARGARGLANRMPALIAPVAATAHLAHMSRPSEGSAAVARALDVAVVAAGVGTAIAALIADRSRGRPLSTLALASAGVLGLLVDRHEREDAAERRRLERRASIVERLVPRRRRRLDHIVVHV